MRQGKVEDEPGVSCLESKEILRERRKNGRKGARGEDRNGEIVCFLIVVIKDTKYKNDKGNVREKWVILS